jgi:hypothetical protein
VDYKLCKTWIIHQEFWGCKVEEELHLRVHEQKKKNLNTTGLKLVVCILLRVLGQVHWFPSNATLFWIVKTTCLVNFSVCRMFKGFVFLACLIKGVWGRGLCGTCSVISFLYFYVVLLWCEIGVWCRYFEQLYCGFIYGIVVWSCFVLA